MSLIPRLQSCLYTNDMWNRFSYEAQAYPYYYQLYQFPVPALPEGNSYYHHGTYAYQSVIRRAIPKKKPEEKPHCHICFKKFTRKAALKIHMRVHTGEKPYVCHECNKAFSQSGNLAAHLRIHQNIRPYKCEECQRTFIQLSSLKNHKKNHHRSEVFEIPMLVPSSNI